MEQLSLSPYKYTYTHTHTFHTAKCQGSYISIVLFAHPQIYTNLQEWLQDFITSIVQFIFNCMLTHYCTNVTSHLTFKSSKYTIQTFMYFALIKPASAFFRPSLKNSIKIVILINIGIWLLLQCTKVIFKNMLHRMALGGSCETPLFSSRKVSTNNFSMDNS